MKSIDEEIFFLKLFPNHLYVQSNLMFNEIYYLVCCFNVHFISVNMVKLYLPTQIFVLYAVWIKKFQLKRIGIILLLSDKKGKKLHAVHSL